MCVLIWVFAVRIIIEDSFSRGVTFLAGLLEKVKDTDQAN